MPKRIIDSEKAGEWYYVRGWWGLQHYKDRNPIWIKLYRAIETDPAFQSLSEIDQWRLVRLWLLSSDMDGRLPRDPGYIGQRLRLYHRQSSVDLLARLEATGLISKQDIRGDKGQSSSPEKRRVEENREEKKEHPNPRLPQGEGAVIEQHDDAEIVLDTLDPECFYVPANIFDRLRKAGLGMGHQGLLAIIMAIAQPKGGTCTLGEVLTCTPKEPQEMLMAAVLKLRETGFLKLSGTDGDSNMLIQLHESLLAVAPITLVSPARCSDRG